MKTGSIFENKGSRQHRGARAVLASVLALAGAATLGGCKADEAKNTGFADPKLLNHDPELPFQKVWAKSGIDYRKYKKIYVAEINTAYMLKNTDWANGERQGDIEKDVRDLAAFTKADIEKAFRDDPNHRLQVLSAPSHDPDTVTLEMALTEVVPSKVVLNALGYAPFGIGITLTAVRFIAKDQSSAAFEARVIDGATGEVIGLAADREAKQFAPVSVRGLTWYSHAKTIIDQWSLQFVQIANRKPGEKIKATDPFTLKPW